MADEEVEEKKSKGGLLKIILFVVGGIVLIAVGLGVGYFVFGSSQPDPSEEIEAIIERKMKLLRQQKHQTITHLQRKFQKKHQSKKNL